jgi:hypothetical protein
LLRSRNSELDAEKSSSWRDTVVGGRSIPFLSNTLYGEA